MGFIHKGAATVILTTVLLLHDPICHGGPHLSLVVFGVKTTEEAYVPVPAGSQMMNQVYINNIE
jgi:hypothetical protein